jgi:hypothetical protein
MSTLSAGAVAGCGARTAARQAAACSTADAAVGKLPNPAGASASQAKLQDSRQQPAASRNSILTRTRGGRCDHCRIDCQGHALRRALSRSTTLLT